LLRLDAFLFSGTKLLLHQFSLTLFFGFRFA